MPLNDHQIRNAKPAAKPYKLADGGLYLAVTPAGGKKKFSIRYRHLYFSRS